MRAGTRLVLLFALVGLAALAVFRLYGDRVVAERAVQSPLAAAREAVQADNTVVGTIGAIRSMTVREMHPVRPGEAPVALAADVVGARGSGTLYADVVPEGSRWRIERARFVGPGGAVVPIEGTEAPSLQP